MDALTDILTHGEIAELAAIAHNAKLLRSVQKKAPHLITICRAMERSAGHLHQPYFGAIATDEGRAALATIRNPS